jgi:hypothetical protein
LQTITARWRGKQPTDGAGAIIHKKYRVKKFSFQAIIEKYLMGPLLYIYING